MRYFLSPVDGLVSLAARPFIMWHEVVLPKIFKVLQFGMAGTVMRARFERSSYASMGGFATLAVSTRVNAFSTCISCWDISRSLLAWAKYLLCLAAAVAKGVFSFWNGNFPDPSDSNVNPCCEISSISVRVTRRGKNVISPICGLLSDTPIISARPEQSVTGRSRRTSFCRWASVKKLSVVWLILTAMKCQLPFAATV